MTYYLFVEILDLWNYINKTFEFKNFYPQLQPPQKSYELDGFSYFLEKLETYLGLILWNIIEFFHRNKYRNFSLYF